jgi:hypothetical protein
MVWATLWAILSQKHLVTLVSTCTKKKGQTGQKAWVRIRLTISNAALALK